MERTSDFCEALPHSGLAGPETASPEIQRALDPEWVSSPQEDPFSVELCASLIIGADDLSGRPTLIASTG